MINVIDFVSLDTLGVKLFLRGKQRLLSHLADAQADLCLHWAYVVYYYQVYCPHCTYDQKWGDVDCGVYEARNP